MSRCGRVVLPLVSPGWEVSRGRSPVRCPASALGRFVPPSTPTICCPGFSCNGDVCVD